MGKKEAVAALATVIQRGKTAKGPRRAKLTMMRINFGIFPIPPKKSKNLPLKRVTPNRPRRGPPIAVIRSPEKAQPNWSSVFRPKRSGKIAFPAPKNIEKMANAREKIECLIEFLKKGLDKSFYTGTFSRKEALDVKR